MSEFIGGFFDIFNHYFIFLTILSHFFTSDRDWAWISKALLAQVRLLRLEDLVSGGKGRLLCTARFLFGFGGCH